MRNWYYSTIQQCTICNSVNIPCHTISIATGSKAHVTIIGFCFAVKVCIVSRIIFNQGIRTNNTRTAPGINVGFAVKVCIIICTNSNVTYACRKTCTIIDIYLRISSNLVFIVNLCSSKEPATSTNVLIVLRNNVTMSINSYSISILIHGIGINNYIPQGYAGIMVDFRSIDYTTTACQGSACT